MMRFSILLFLGLLVGCNRSSPPKQGVLVPYLQLTQGTPVVVHLKGLSPGTVATRAGTLHSISPEMVYVREQPSLKLIGYPSNVVGKIEVPK